MSLIEHDHAILGELWVVHGLSQKHTVGHILQQGLPRGGLIFESDCVANLLTQHHVHLFTHSLGHTHGRDTARLGAAYRLTPCDPRLQEELWNLSSFSTAGLSLEH